MLVSAGAGGSAWCRTMGWMLLNGEDIIKFNHNFFSATRQSANEEETKGYDLKGSMIIITTQQIHVLQFNNRSQDTYRNFPLDTSEILTIGSGASYAYAAAFVGQLTAVQAVAAAGQCNSSTGLHVESYNCFDPQRAVREDDFSKELIVKYRPV